MKMRLAFCCLLTASLAMLAGCHPAEHLHAPGGYNLPPAARLMEPGPGVGGPGPGVIHPPAPVMPVGFMGAVESSQVSFIGPEGTHILFDIGGHGMFDSDVLVAPARHMFGQGGIYRLKLANIPGREGVELYPTLEIGPATPRTGAYLAHAAIPVQFTEEDLDQVLSGNFVTKVIYLPDPEFQELALARVETLVSTRLDPGVDPIVEADRRGAILAIVRIGNKDLEVPGMEEIGGIAPVGYNAAVGDCGPYGGGGAYGPVATGPGGLPPGFVAGVTTPMYGMPMSGTPIGLPGPPHVPLGVPAGLQKHAMVNRTHMHIPDPVDDIRIKVRQQPGLSYPKPPSRGYILEQTIHPTIPMHQPWGNTKEVMH